MRHIKKILVKPKLAAQHHRSSITGIGLLLAGLLVIWASNARSLYIPNNFSYSAAVAVTSHDYDIANRRYTGSQYSIGNYSVQNQGTADNVATLRRSIDINNVHGIHVGETAHTYTADATTGKYLDITKADAGYVFAPRNLRKGQSFNYQHVLYPRTATMEYAGAEMIGGLDAYRYHAVYGSRGSLIPIDDLTKALGTKNQELLTAPDITIWVEPQTGWLLQYQEKSTVYLANASTHKIISPLYNFAASFTNDSIQQQAEYAKGLKMQLSLGQQIIPGLIFLFVLVLAIAAGLRHYGRWSLPIIGSLAAALALVATSSLSWFMHLPALNTWFQNNIALNPLTSLCFMLIITGITFLYKARWRYIAIAASGIVLMLCMLQMLSRLRFIPWRPDLALFHDDLLRVIGTPPAHMSLVTSTLFIILALALLKGLLTSERPSVRFVRLATGTVFVTAVTALGLGALGFNRSFNVSSIATTSPLEWFVFLLVALVLFQISHERHGHSTDIRSVARGLLAQCAVALPVLLIGLAAQLQQNATQRQLQTAFATDTTTITQTLQNKLAVYTNMLVGARTLFAASMSVERDEWHQYISALDIAKNYPGIQSVGFIKHTAATDVQGLIANARSSGANNFTIFPKSSGEAYDPVLYVEPRNVATGRTLGFDMSTDTVRNQAMAIARDQGTPTLSDATTLLQETDNPSRGFLIFVPVYRNGLPATTVAERRAALDGYVYAVFDSAPTIQTMLAGQTDVIDTAVYDNIQTDTSSLLYDTSSLEERNRHGDRIIAASPSNPLLKTTIIYGDNHPWTVQLIAKPNTSKYANNQRAASLVYIVGISLYLLAVSLFYSLRSTRRRSGTATRHKRRNKQ